MIKQHLVVGVYAGTKIPQTLKNAMKKAVINGNYLNISNFIREAIKEKLQREGYAALKKTPQYTKVEGQQSSDTDRSDD